MQTNEPPKTDPTSAATEAAASFFRGDATPDTPAFKVQLPEGAQDTGPVPERPKPDLPRDTRFDTPVSENQVRQKRAITAILKNNFPPEVTDVTPEERIRYVAALGLPPEEGERFYLDLQPILDHEKNGVTVRIRDRTFLEDDIIGMAARRKAGDANINLLSALTWTTRYSLAAQLVRVGSTDMKPFTADPEKTAAEQVDALIATYERMFNRRTAAQGHICLVAGLLFTMKINALELGCVHDDFFTMPICAQSIELAQMGS